MNVSFARSMCRAGAALFASAVLSSAWAQKEPKPETPQAGSTVLDTGFASKLSEAWVYWPSGAEQAASEVADTDRARQQVCLWIVELLSPKYRPFESTTDMISMHSALDGAIEQTALSTFKSRLTAAVLCGGKDVLCHRWSAGEYLFQLEMTETGGWLCVEPRVAGARGSLGPNEATDRIGRVIRGVLNGGEKSLSMGRLRTNAQPHGFTMTFQPDDEAAWRQAFKGERYEAPLWMKYMQVQTDAYSVALNFATWVFDAVPVRDRGRWFAPPPRTGQPAEIRPTSAPAPDPNEVQAKLKLLKELADQKRRERQAREAEQQAQR